MRAVLTQSETYEVADAAALEVVGNAFAPVVAMLSEEYYLQVEFDKGTANEDRSGD